MVDRGGTTQRFVAALAGVALVLAVSACNATPPSATPGHSTVPDVASPSPTAVSPRPSATAVVSSSPIPAILPDLSQSPHAGALLISAQGTVGREIPLSALASGSHKVAIRFACVGPTGAQLTDLLGGVVMGVSGCDGHGIYGVDFTSSAKDGSIRVGVEPVVSWEIAVFWAL